MTTLTSDQIEKLEALAWTIRYRVVEMTGVGKAGHIGGSCSAAEIVAALYGYKMRHDPANPGCPDRDRFIMSKGHAALAQYAALAESGYFPVNEIYKVKSLGGMLQGHPDLRRTPGIEANTGSLGQGLSIAAGIALGLRLDGFPSKVYTLVGDGEIAEGQIWEAAMAASNFKLDHLVAIVDYNKIQATGEVRKRFDTNPMGEKWASFGWRVLEIDGHDIKAICGALDASDDFAGQPVAIVAHTIKGKGISFAEGKAAFHNAVLDNEQYQLALSLLEAKRGECSCKS
jgi:transketolase